MPHSRIADVVWCRSNGLVGYAAAMDAMSRRAALIGEGAARELIWLLEHPPLYTAGTSARSGDLLDSERFPVFHSGRGGQYTYHGPGQRIVYTLLDVRRRTGGDVRALVGALEGIVIETLDTFEIRGEVRPGRVGVWVKTKSAGMDNESKIAAVGLRVSRGIASHGFSINVNPELSHYDGIVACGIRNFGVTSLATLNCLASMKDVDNVLLACLDRWLGPLREEPPPI
jgi:lipoyl(octanoyl) transferase